MSIGNGDKVKQDADLQTVKNKAVDFLSRREHSEQELRSKLEKKGYESSLVEQALAAMLEAGYLSDSRYARMVIRTCFEKGQGPQKVRSTLKQKGLSSELVNEGMEAFEGDWFELARMARLRKFREPLDPSDRVTYFKEKSRQMRFLAGRGFTMEQIEYAMASHHDEDAHHF